ncbi:MAG: hypothetical protein GXO86_12410 [Chlorobi bacterium]|nr:hypothetical protein [Chlorobiota bacterium]
MNTRVESKISVLNDTLVKIFRAELNLARIKFISLFIIALCKVQTVTFEKIAVAFENEAYTSSPFLTDLDRIEKLLSLVLITFVWVYKIGIYLNSLKPIPVKKHGRKAYSLFKFGLNSLAKVINTNNLDKFKNYCEFLSYT